MNDERDPNDPMARWFAQFGGDGKNFDLQQMLDQLRSALGSVGATQLPTVDWSQTTSLAHAALLAKASDPDPTIADDRAVADAHRLASAWLDEFVAFEPLSTPPAAWSRSTWIEQTSAGWQSIAEPIVNRIADAMADSFGAQFQMGEGTPVEFEQFGSMLTPILRASAAQMYSVQVSKAISIIATQLLSGAELGLQLLSKPQVVMLPANIAAFGEDLGVSEQELLLYLTLREEARQRLFAQVPWLGPQLISLLAQYTSQITIDLSDITDSVDVDDLQGLEPEQLSALSEDLQEQLFAPACTAQQADVLIRMETLLDLIEGWVDATAGAAATKWLPHVATMLDETIRRRRVTSYPADAFLTAMLGLDMRPERFREATALWRMLEAERGIEARDKLWSHPDLLPGSAELEDPSELLGTAPGGGVEPDEIDIALEKLLAEEDRHNEEGPKPD